MIREVNKERKKHRSKNSPLESNRYCVKLIYCDVRACSGWGGNRNSFFFFFFFHSQKTAVKSRACIILKIEGMSCLAMQYDNDKVSLRNK